MLPLATDIQIKEPPPPLHCTHGREVKKRAKEGDHLNYVQYLKRQQFAAARGGWPRGRVALTNNRSVRDSDTAAVDAAARSPLRWWRGVRPSVTRVRMRCLFFRERRRRSRIIPSLLPRRFSAHAFELAYFGSLEVRDDEAKLLLDSCHHRPHDEKRRLGRAELSQQRAHSHDGWTLHGRPNRPTFDPLPRLDFLIFLTGLVNFVFRNGLRPTLAGQKYAIKAEFYPNLSQQSVTLPAIH